MKIHNNTKNFIKKHWFIIAIIFLFIIKFLITDGQILRVKNSSHDDGYFINAVDYLLKGQWLGPYNDITLSKGVTGILFIAFAKIIGLGLLRTLSVLYFIACLSIINSLRHFIKDKKILLLIYALLLFNPISFSDTFSMVYRDGIYTVLLMFLLSFSIQIFNRYKEELLPYIIYTILYGIVITFTILCREETLYAASYIFISIVLLVILILKNKCNKKIIRILIITLIPGLIYAGTCHYIGVQNYEHYKRYVVNDFTSKDFQDLYGALTRIKQKNYKLRVPLNKETREELYELSPTFKLLKTCLEGPDYEHYRVSAKTKDYQEGFLYWAVRGCAYKSGYYSNANNAYNYNVTLANEINDICDSKKLECYPKRSSLIAPINGEMIKEYINYIPKTLYTQLTYERVLVTWDQKTNYIDKYLDLTLDSFTYDNDGYEIQITLMKTILLIYQLLNPALFVLSMILFIKILIKYIKKETKDYRWLLLISSVFFLYALRLAVVCFVASCEYSEAILKAQYLAPSFILGLLFSLLVIIISRKLKVKMNKVEIIILIIISLLITGTFINSKIEENKIRHSTLTRGLIVARTSEGALVSWRSLKDDKNTCFKLYKNNKLLVTLDENSPTNYFDKDYKKDDVYTLKSENETVRTEMIFDGINEGSTGAYYDIKLSVPRSVTGKGGETVTYNVGDIVPFDVDADNKYEFIVKWEPSNLKDNAEIGYTSNTYIDCYNLRGNRLWRIDLGKNIRSGPSYTQILVNDYDNDGIGELILKTADGTKDAYGKIIGDKYIDNRNKEGLILKGNEYLSLFDASTGKELDTILYEPARDDTRAWGDDYGNRSERFLATSAYLDKNKPSAVLVRGIYTRMVAVSYNIENKKFKKIWTFDTNNEDKSIEGNVNHQIVAADVDDDGKDEIVFGSLVLDDNGKVLYNSNFGHGDVLHVGDFDKDNKGLEIFMCHENPNYGISLRDAKTGKILFRKEGTQDTGRCLIDNFISNNSSYEMVGLYDKNVYTTKGKIVGNWYKDNPKWSKEKDKGINFAVYWDERLERELLDDIEIKRYKEEPIFIAKGVKSINGTKRNPALSADLFGDYREEVIYPTIDNRFLRIFTTTIYTNNKVTTLMSNKHYKSQVLNQNVGYNIPPHLDYYLGD